MFITKKKKKTNRKTKKKSFIKNKQKGGMAANEPVEAEVAAAANESMKAKAAAEDEPMTSPAAANNSMKAKAAAEEDPMTAPAAAAEEDELFVDNPFERPQADEFGYVSLYKWDWPRHNKRRGVFARWIDENVGKEVGFTPFNKNEPKINCYDDPYKKKKTDCWKFRGPNSLFFTTKEDFNNELIFRFSELKRTYNGKPSIEELREIKNSMLGYTASHAQELIEMKAQEQHLIAPCINKS